MPFGPDTFVSPELIGALKMTEVSDKNVDQRVKMAIIHTVEAIGPSAMDAVPALEALADYEDRYVRDDARKAIKVIRGHK